MRKLLLTAAIALGATAAVQAQTVSCNAGFTISQTSFVPPYQVAVANTSTFTPAGPYVYAYGNIHYGDGSSPGWTTPGYTATHNYTNPGTYTVSLAHYVVDSMTSQILCSDSTTQTFTVAPGSGNVITGFVYWDPIATLGDSLLAFKVWLIQHDATANTLTAIDSTNVNINNGVYAFNNAASGEYLVKAAPLMQNSTASFGLVPTYHDSSVYWSGASTINHFSQLTSNKNIWIRNGTVTSGPGFVGGNISAGAGKGTGTGVPGLLVFLRNSSNNKLISSVYTDANGDYAFSNIAAGSYNVYPEAMSYATTPSSVLTITGGQTSSTGVDFIQTEDQIKPKSLSISGVTKEDGISIYPNPASDVLVIENKAGKFNHVSIVNTLGQVVKQQNINKGNNKIEISAMTSGLYYVIINGGEGARSVKISKK